MFAETLSLGATSSTFYEHELIGIRFIKTRTGFCESPVTGMNALAFLLSSLYLIYLKTCP